MKVQNLLVGWSAALLLILVTCGPSMAQKQEPGILSLTVQSTFSCGSGAGLMQFSISTHGNLVSFTSPKGSQHINSEGYVLCDANTEGFDSGRFESGCGDATVSQPNGANTFPLTITRNCGCIQFKQAFSAQDCTEKDFTITMTAKNVCSFTLPNVRITRYFDGDIDLTEDDDLYIQTPDSVAGIGLHGLSLTALDFAASHSTAIELFEDWNSGGREKCEATGTPPSGRNDFVGRVEYSLGDLAPAASKTRKVTYRRF
jgi:hypothetical protein